MPEKMRRSLRLRSGQALRRESFASRATPLPQDNKSKIKSNVKSDGQECPSHTNIRQGLKPSFFFLMLIGTSRALPGRARIEVCGSFRHRRQRVPFDFAQGRFLTVQTTSLNHQAHFAELRHGACVVVPSIQSQKQHQGRQIEIKSNVKGDGQSLP